MVSRRLSVGAYALRVRFIVILVDQPQMTTRLTDTATIDGEKAFPDKDGRLRVNPGSSVSMSCSASGSPSPDLSYAKNGVVVSAAGRVSVETTDAGALDLTIDDIRASDSSGYVCTANNDAGADSSRIVVAVTGTTMSMRFRRAIISCS